MAVGGRRNDEKRHKRDAFELKFRQFAEWV